MNKLRYLTDAAMTTTIMIAVLLFSHFTGAEIEELFPFLIPIPVALYSMKYGFRKGLIPFVAISALSLLHNPIHGLLYITSGNTIGLIYGSYLKKFPQNKWSVGIALIGSLIINILTLLVFSRLLYGYTILEDIQEKVQSFFMKFPTDNVKIKAMIEAIAVGLIPSIIIIMSVLEGYLFHFLTSLLANRMFKHSTDIIKIPSFRIPIGISIGYLCLIALNIVSLVFFDSITGFIKILWTVVVNLTAIGGLMFIVLSLMYFASLARVKHKAIIYYLACLGLLLFPLHVVNGVIVSLFKLDAKLHP